MSAERRAVVDALWKQMAERGDFPTLTHSMHHIVAAVQSETDHIEKVVSAVISDFALTQKVLRLANSAMYAPFGGNITTVSRAALVLGQETIGHLALGLRLLDSFKGMATDREKARQALAQAMLSGLVARRLTEHVGIKEGEEAVVCALLSRLGELVCIFYAPDEWAAIEASMEEGATADAAAEAVLGVSLSELGQEIARRWGLPGTLCDALKPFEPPQADEPLSHVEWLQAMSAFSTELAAAVAGDGSADTREVAERYTPLLALDPEITQEAVEALSAEAAIDGGWDGLAEVYFEKPGREADGKPADSEQRLAAGVAEIAQSLAECEPSALLHMALEVMQTSLGCARTMLFVAAAPSGRYVARAGYGKARGGELAALSFEGGFAPDVFHLTLSSKKPVHIENAADAKIRRRIPAWHRNALDDARSITLLPLIVHGRAAALLYADWTSADPTCLTSSEMQLLAGLARHVAQALQAEAQIAAHGPPG
jgi:HD-like signal output (HDOD) protein